MFYSATVAVGLYGNDDVHNAILRVSSTLRAVQHNIDAVKDQVFKYYYRYICTLNKVFFWLFRVKC